jgi:hypothetical protein
MIAAAEYSPYQAAVFRILDSHYRPLRNAAKILARHGRATPKTAENWLAKKHAPRGDQLIALCANCDALADEIFRMVAELKASRNEPTPSQLRGTDGKA